MQINLHYCIICICNECIWLSTTCMEKQAPSYYLLVCQNQTAQWPSSTWESCDRLSLSVCSLQHFLNIKHLNQIHHLITLLSTYRKCALDRRCNNNNIQPTSLSKNHTSYNALKCAHASLTCAPQSAVLCYSEDMQRGLYSNVYVSWEGDKVSHFPPGDYVKPLTALRKLIKWNCLRHVGQTDKNN